MSEDNFKKCEFCSLKSPRLMLCSACKVVRYCSKEHQKKHWSSHKSSCQQSKISKESLMTNKQSKSSKVKVAHVDGQENALTLSHSLLDSVLPNNQVYSNGSSYQEADLSTPIDSESGVDDHGIGHDSTGNAFHSFYQLALTPDHDLLVKRFGSNWLQSVTSLVLRDLNTYGFCAIDNFLGKEYASQVLSEVVQLHNLGILSDGKVVSRQVQAQAMGMIRGDKITWVTGSEPACKTIRQLVSIIDSVITNANKHPEAGQLTNYNITFRTRAMVACYPGGGSRYVKHIDNPNRDGRCITAIYYLNENWQKEHGGMLRIHPEGLDRHVAEISPNFDRMLFFWSDRRNPHEVLPSISTRYAITVWYLDQDERKQYLTRCSSLSPSRS